MVRVRSRFRSRWTSLGYDSSTPESRRAVGNREMIREHALGEALALKAFERLARYEVHLDRKLERTLTMLIRLNDLRRGSPET